MAPAMTAVGIQVDWGSMAAKSFLCIDEAWPDSRRRRFKCVDFILKLVPGLGLDARELDLTSGFFCANV